MQTTTLVQRRLQFPLYLVRLGPVGWQVPFFASRSFRFAFLLPLGEGGGLPLADPPVAGWKRWLLLRRSLTDPTQVTPYVCLAPAATSLAALVRVTGMRWTIESGFESTKQEVGLDEYEVRTYQGWYRHITLACLAHAFLTVLRAHGLDPLTEPEKKRGIRPNRVRLRPSKPGVGLSAADRARNSVAAMEFMTGSVACARFCL